VVERSFKEVGEDGEDVKGHDDVLVSRTVLYGLFKPLDLAMLPSRSPRCP
jgi:hypothetical protein